MNQVTKRVATAVAGFAVALAAPATAAHAAGATTAVPTTVPVSCTSTQVRVKLWNPAGMHCYTGPGSLLVNLPGVRQEQVVGLHTVCLLSSTHTIRCVRGPAVVAFPVPIEIVEITVDSPVA